MKCRICDNEESNRPYLAREMMFGYRDEFAYFQCAECNCLQIDEVPADISRYYPEDYYAYETKEAQNPIKKLLINKRDRFALQQRGLAGRVLSEKYPRLDLLSLGRLDTNTRTRILDVGCGAGALLVTLSKHGFNNLKGLDPFNQADLKYANGLCIDKKSIHDEEGQWDVIMFHHSFEHVPDPKETLKSVARLLSEDGHCIIRIPTVSSYAWEHYGVNWVQLDAPRHFYLHSSESMHHIAGLAGLEIYDAVYDSTSFQFTGSEQYLQDIPLHDLDSKGGIELSKAEIKDYNQKAKALNKDNRGDQAVFYIRKQRIT